ncbi:ribosome assembly cofactor RimP [Mycoplasma crocodyli]|uniref:Ribosome maturation factor RimP C-terminal domain-containing protein n=1 Tax=Mycoplasma crocodyli (strain ATCC 51981 / MP145) TaxID=512564 RepID=D5E4K4_MYCCM|nr:ribosome assembly cofactor RimP [Mycoplasma crocodyli]ADE20007.1 conserved hypothetical protein [Mycoplasma crocodyli MP145]
MDRIEKIKNKFNDAILEIKELKNDQDFTLEIVLDTRDLKTVEKYTREIYDFLENESLLGEDTSLDILSKGSDIIVSIDEIEKFIGKKLVFSLKKEVMNTLEIPGKLLSVDGNNITIQFNQKGLLRKVELNKENIKEVKIYF